MRARSNLAEISARYRRRAGAFRPESGQAARIGAERLETASRDILRQRIYAVPIPTASGAASRSASGFTAPGRVTAWERTGELLEAERAEARGLTIILTNSSDHALARYRLGTARGRKIKSPGIKSVQWQAEATKKMRPILLNLRHQAVVRTLKRR